MMDNKLRYRETPDSEWKIYEGSWDVADGYLRIGQPWGIPAESDLLLLGQVSTLDFDGRVVPKSTATTGLLLDRSHKGFSKQTPATADMFPDAPPQVGPAWLHPRLGSAGLLTQDVALSLGRDPDVILKREHTYTEDALAFTRQVASQAYLEPEEWHTEDNHIMRLISALQKGGDLPYSDSYDREFSPLREEYTFTWLTTGVKLIVDANVQYTGKFSIVKPSPEPQEPTPVQRKFDEYVKSLLDQGESLTEARRAAKEILGVEARSCWVLGMVSQSCLGSNMEVEVLCSQLTLKPKSTSGLVRVRQRGTYNTFQVDAAAVTLGVGSVT